MRVGAFQSPDVGAPSTYTLNNFVRPLEKFLETFEAKVSRKLVLRSSESQKFRAEFLKKHLDAYV